MIETITSHAEPAGWEAKWGKYNDFPPNWRELTEAGFATSHFFTYSFERREFRQMRRPDAPHTEPYLSATLYFMHDGTGYSIVNDFWKGTVRYFMFGCAHTTRGLSMKECHDRGIYHAGRCYHVSECTLCGHINAVDSSD